MNYRLLETKFHIPPWREEGVTRTRLLKRLHAGLAELRKLTLVSAPAGYGKTTLIVDWIHSLGGISRVVLSSLPRRLAISPSPAQGSSSRTRVPVGSGMNQEAVASAMWFG